MAAIFRPSANLAAKFALLGMATGVLLFCFWWWVWPRTDWDRRQNWRIDQPVPFSHEHHVAGLGIDCRFCHNGIELASKAPMPPTYTCMTCHSQIWTNADLLEPVRQSLATNTPIVWAKVTDVPYYVYFDHSIHVTKGVGCETCHGHVERMPLMVKARTMTMNFCLDCHRNPAPNLRPPEAIYDMEWKRGPGTPSPQALMAMYHIGGRNLTDCSVCHR